MRSSLRDAARVAPSIFPAPPFRPLGARIGIFHSSSTILTGGFDAADIGGHDGGHGDHYG